jgi:hypothetical protein
MRQQVQRVLEPHALDEVVQRLAHQRLEDAVEVVGRETGDARHVVQRQRLGQVPQDMVDGAVDALDIVRAWGGRDVRKTWQVGHRAPS